MAIANVINRFGSTVAVGDEVVIFSITPEGVEGGTVKAFWMKIAGRHRIEMANVVQASGRIVTVFGRDCIPASAAR